MSFIGRPARCAGNVGSILLSYGLLIYGIRLFIKEPNFKHWFYLILMSSAAWAWFKGMSFWSRGYLSTADANKSAVKWSTDSQCSAGGQKNR